jgi:trehalose synthase
MLHEVQLRAEPIDRFGPILGEETVAEARRLVDKLHEVAGDRIVWNVNSTAVGGGVAEMLRSLLVYTRGGGIDTRWVVISGTPEFFKVTKRLHNAIHGARGDGSPLGPEQRKLYENIVRENSDDLVARLRPRDVVLLHDPQTAGLARAAKRAGAAVIWRCHIGADCENDDTQLGWAFLQPYIQYADMCVFSRSGYIPRILESARTAVIVPRIDPFSAKNQVMDPATVRAIVTHVGLVAGTEEGSTRFLREDGSPGRIDRMADIVRLGPTPSADTPMVVQVSRWDELKDAIGVLEGFGRLVRAGSHAGAELVLAGPNVHAVADDPDSVRVFDDLTRAWRSLPHNVRKQVTLATLPTEDVEENAAIVNALQRHATIIVQKSIHEGFGLTVTEAMWKGRAIVASAVGGIVDQITDDVHGLLLKDPRDLDAFAGMLKKLLNDPALAGRLGDAAHERTRERFLALHSLVDYGRLIATIDQR